jgi:hypothetical protein
MNAYTNSLIISYMLGNCRVLGGYILRTRPRSRARTAVQSWEAPYSLQFPNIRGIIGEFV